MKRLIDIFVSALGLLITGPIIVLFMFLVWLHDGGSPFYVAPRVGLRGKVFKMIKLRSMTVNADKSGVDSTSDSDCRITGVGKIIRKYKLDELTQLFNVLRGDMSLVGPRPNVQREVALYTSVEMRLLTVKPGITDFASIVFADEGKILSGSKDPDLKYNQLIRPWKSRLGLFYIDCSGSFVDLIIILITVMTMFSRDKALRVNCAFMNFLKAPNELLVVASRTSDLIPIAPPGSDCVVLNRSSINYKG